MKPSDRFALVITVSEFDDPEFDSLPGAAADGSRMSQFLADGERGAFGEVVTLESPASHEARLAIGDVFARAAAVDGLALVYFATHGLTDGPDGLALALRDSRADRRTTTMLPVTALTSVLAEHRVPRTVVVIDACESGGASAGAGRLASDKLWSDAIAKHVVPEGHFLMAACGTRESAGEDDEGGVFTSLLLELPARLGEAHPAQEWIQAEVLAQAARRLAEARGESQRPEWSGLSVAVDVPICKNPCYEPDYASPQTLLQVAEFSKEARAALAPAVSTLWSAYRKVTTSAWLADALASVDLVAGLNLDGGERLQFWTRLATCLERRLADRTDHPSRAVFQSFMEELIVRLGSIDALDDDLASKVAEWMVQFADAGLRGLATSEGDAPWMQVHDGPASIALAPIRYWDLLGQASVSAIACRSKDPVAADRLVQAIEQTVVDHPRLHRVVWIGQYPDVAVTLGLLLHHRPGVAGACAKRMLSRRLKDRAEGRRLAPVDASTEELGESLAENVCGVQPSPRNQMDEGVALLLLTTLQDGGSEAELAVRAAAIASQREVGDASIYLPETPAAQFSPNMSECTAVSWPASEEGLNRLLADEDTWRSPYASIPVRGVDVLASAAAGRVYRNRAGVWLLDLIPRYLRSI